MKARIGLLIALVGTCCTMWGPGHSASAASLCPTPTVSSVSPHTAAPGGTVTLNGSGLQAVGCSTAVDIAGTPVSGVNAQPGSITFPAAYGLSGPVRVRLIDSVGNPSASNTNLTFFTTPQAASVSPAAPAVGQAVSLSGRGFDLNIPSGDASVSATYLWHDGSSCQAASAAIASDTAISVSPPTHYCYGPLAVVITAPADTNSPSATRTTVFSGTAGTIDVAASGGSFASGTAPAGSTLQVQGSGFGSSGSATVGGLPAASAWSDTGVGVVIPDTAVNNASVTITRAGDGTSIGVKGTLTVAARVDGVSPYVAAPGSTVSISGGGFGSHAGTVHVGVVNLPVFNWSPTSITVSIPAAARSGSLAIAPVDTAPPATPSWLTVSTSLSPGSSVSGGGVVGVTSLIPPARVPTVDTTTPSGTIVGSAPPPFNPPPHPSGPVALTLRAPESTAQAGRTVPFTVSLQSFGHPVTGAPVQLLIVYEPGTDGAITPAAATTDANGEVHGLVRLSRTPGEMIILARSGTYSDEIRLIGSSATTTGATLGDGAPLLKGGVPGILFAGLIAVATLLLLTGVGLRVALAFGGDGEQRSFVRLPLWLRADVQQIGVRCRGVVAVLRKGLRFRR